MGSVGCGLSIVAGFFALIGLIPFLGWLNWLTTLPAALLAIFFGVVALIRGEQNAFSILGLIAGVMIFCWAIFRLGLGGGVV